MNHYAILLSSLFFGSEKVEPDAALIFYDYAEPRGLDRLFKNLFFGDLRLGLKKTHFFRASPTCETRGVILEPKEKECSYGNYLY